MILIQAAPARAAIYLLTPMEKILLQEPVLAFFLVVLLSYFSFQLLEHLADAFLRHLSIWFRGWPPPHLDADGHLRDDGQDGY